MLREYPHSMLTGFAIVKPFAVSLLLTALVAVPGAAQPSLMSCDELSPTIDVVPGTVASVAKSPVRCFVPWGGRRPAPSLSVGKWLLLENGKPAHWLEGKHQGKSLLEPINVIIYDPFAASADEAEDRLIDASRRGGYTLSLGHSSEYCGYIGGVKYDQIAAWLPLAFADGNCFRPNNHGRLIGPGSWNGGFVFIGAFSRECFRLVPTVGHVFLSFGAARDDYCTRLASSGLYTIVGRADLGNSLDLAYLTTADHDGVAIVLEAKE